VLVAGGATVCRDVVFTADPALECGATVTATFSLQDGATDFGTTAADFPTGVPVAAFEQGFDGVTAPTLPSGWTASNAAGNPPFWVTSAGLPDTPPNSAFVNDPSVVSDKRLDAPAMAIVSAAARLTFRNSYNLENGFDGGVLEIAIDGAPFADILVAGGSFVSNGYVGTIDTGSSSPIGGRQAWTGNSGGYVTTVVDLPAAAAGHSVVLRWRMASDNGVSGIGWRIDTITLSDGYACCTALTATALAVDVDPASSPANLDGVWEPGEMVVVSPSYVNNTLAALPLSGTASNLGGPSGASYAITDGSADYGAIAAGATAACAAGNCYACR
jgi:hypothetical protein